MIASASAASSAGQPDYGALIAGLGAQRNGVGYKALCPTHTDQTPSLSISVKDGRVLVRQPYAGEIEGRRVNDIAEHATASREGAFESVSPFDGASRILSYKKDSMLRERKGGWHHDRISMVPPPLFLSSARSTA